MMMSVRNGVLIALLSYYTTALLVLLPHTFQIRLALLPITLIHLIHLLHIDLSAANHSLAYLNQGLVLATTVIAIRAIIWTFQPTPYKRLHNLPSTYSQLLLDAADLSFNLRGIGWSWSPLPNLHTKSPTSSLSFFLHTLLSFLLHIVFFDITHRLVQNFDTNTIGSPLGGSIFDPSLPPLYRYSRSTLITFIAGFTIYAGIQTPYHFLTLFSLIFLRHSPSQWPPLFNNPWLSTSLSQFWSTRWHQLFRDIFVSFGGNTLAFLIGPLGNVLGAFFVSGLLHTVGIWAMGRGSDFLRVTGFFMIMAVGTLFEHSWKSLTGSRVDGFLGRIWTFLWLLGWGNMLIDAWTTKGLVGSTFFPDGYRPSDYILQPWIKSWNRY